MEEMSALHNLQNRYEISLSINRELTDICRSKSRFKREFNTLFLVFDHQEDRIESRLFIDSSGDDEMIEFGKIIILN